MLGWASGTIRIMHVPPKDAAPLLHPGMALQINTISNQMEILLRSSKGQEKSSVLQYRCKLSGKIDTNAQHTIGAYLPDLKLDSRVKFGPIAASWKLTKKTRKSKSRKKSKRKSKIVQAIEDNKSHNSTHLHLHDVSFSTGSSYATAAVRWYQEKRAPSTWLHEYAMKFQHGIVEGNALWNQNNRVVVALLTNIHDTQWFSAMLKRTRLPRKTQFKAGITTEATVPKSMSSKSLISDVSPVCSFGVDLSLKNKKSVSTPNVSTVLSTQSHTMQSYALPDQSLPVVIAQLDGPVSLQHNHAESSPQQVVEPLRVRSAVCTDGSLRMYTMVEQRPSNNFGYTLSATFGWKFGQRSKSMAHMPSKDDSPQGRPLHAFVQRSLSSRIGSLQPDDSTLSSVLGSGSPRSVGLQHCCLGFSAFVGEPKIG
jgi:hypothetical protein